MALPVEAVMAIGDGGNDLQLVANVGWGIAMGNAVPAVCTPQLLYRALVTTHAAQFFTCARISHVSCQVSQYLQCSLCCANHKVGAKAITRPVLALCR